MAAFEWLDFEDTGDRDRLVVEWMLSSACNFRCAYCPPRLHDGKIHWPARDSIMRFCCRVMQHYQDKNVTFLFTGGEPTFYPGLLSISKHARSIGAQVAVLSNASRPVSWWENAVGCFDQAILSFHPNQADAANFISVVDVVALQIPVQINLMMIPGQFNKSLKIAEAIEHQNLRVSLHYKPILDDWKSLAKYSAEEQSTLRQLNSASACVEHATTGTVVKGSLCRRSSDGKTEMVTPTELLLRAENKWAGWECWIGVETLFITGDEVRRGVCGVGGLLGSIHDEFHFPETAVICNHETCNCIGGMKATKRKLNISNRFER